MRLDKYLVENGFFTSRSKALAAIKNQAVAVDGFLVTKAALEVEKPKIEIIKDICPYVSRGGLKLESAIKNFGLDFANKVVLDIGASTGGFTDCALKFKAKRVYAVDVGTSQLANSLKNNQAVVSLENTNILKLESLPEKPDIVVMDVSFISITKLLKALDRFITCDNYLVCLIKPQFEVGKIYLKNGIVKDKKLHLSALKAVDEALSAINLGIKKIICSPILGGSGNREFLALIVRNHQTKIDFSEVVNYA